MHAAGGSTHRMPSFQTKRLRLGFPKPNKCKEFVILVVAIAVYGWWNPRDFRWFGKDRLQWFWATFFLDLFLLKKHDVGNSLILTNRGGSRGGPSRGKSERTDKMNFRPLFFPQDVAIPVGPKVSLHTAETLERNIENELKENAGRPRYVLEWRHGECFFCGEWKLAVTPVQTFCSFAFG